MTTTLDLVAALKAELRRAGVTYADLAKELGMAESSIKRIFAKGDMPLSRIDEVLAVLKLDFADLAARVLHTQPLREALTLEQEKAVVADRKLLLVAICALSQWTFDQIISTYTFSEADLSLIRQRRGDANRLGAHVTLIPLNPTPGFVTRGSSAARVAEFRDRLVDLGVNATVRQNRGTEIDAACGQLRGRSGGAELR